MNAAAAPTAAGIPIATTRPALYPVFLDLVGRRVVVVGGGAVGEEKVEGLLETGAEVLLIARELTSRLSARVAEGRVELLRRAFRRGDLAGAFLVLAERSDPETEGEIFAEAQERGIFANVQDRLPRCSFQAPALLRRGDLAVAISTAGSAPALASRLRRRLEEQLGPEIGELLAMVGPLRDELSRRFPDFSERKRRWYRLVDSPVLEELREGRVEAARKLIRETLGVTPEAPP